jgi:hypothetical protein
MKKTQRAITRNKVLANNNHSEERRTNSMYSGTQISILWNLLLPSSGYKKLYPDDGGRRLPPKQMYLFIR